jgi:selenocysteine lyase/cysteine desulfurase
VVSVTARDVDVAQLGERLDRDYEIAVRTGLQCAPGAHRALGTFPSGTLRISPGCFTTEAEIDAFAQALGECLDDALVSKTPSTVHHREP